MDLSALSDFNLVAAQGGYGRASRFSGRPKASLSRHVAELEQHLGVRLVERDGRAFKLTEDGRSLHARTEGLLSDIQHVGRDIASGRTAPRGRLRVSVPVTFGGLGLGATIARFALTYPEVQVEVTVEDRVVDLIEEDYDIVIRANPEPNSDLVGRCFQRHEMLVVAAPSLLKPAWKELMQDGVVVPAVVGRAAPDVQRWTVRDGTSEFSFARKAVLRMSSPNLRRDAVVAGAGVAILARDLVRDDLAASRLCAWGVVPGTTVEMWVLHTSRRLVSSKVSAFVAFICDAAPQDA